MSQPAGADTPAPTDVVSIDRFVASVGNGEVPFPLNLTELEAALRASVSGGAAPDPHALRKAVETVLHWIANGQPQNYTLDEMVEQLRAALRAGGASENPSDTVDAVGLSVICRDCGNLIAGVEAGDRVHFVTCRPCFDRATPKGATAGEHYHAKMLDRLLTNRLQRAARGAPAKEG